MNMNICKLFLISVCVCFSSCNSQDMILLRSKQKLPVETGTALIMDYKSVGKISNVAIKGDDYIYTVKLTDKIDLRLNASIEVSYPLIGDKPNLKILNRGTNSLANSDDIIDIKVSNVEEKRFGDTINAASILRAIADSIDAHNNKR